MQPKPETCSACKWGMAVVRKEPIYAYQPGSGTRDVQKIECHRFPRYVDRDPADACGEFKAAK